MAKVKLSENLFLEVAELERYRQFIEEDGWKKVLKSIVKSPGIVKNEGNTNFKVTKQDNEHILINSGLAFDPDLNAIISEQNEVREVLKTSNTRWVILSRAVHNNEKGTVNITADGTLMGYGTEFTKVLRGQPNFPTKVKFIGSVKNNSEYEIVQVNSDTSAILVGEEVTAEQELKYSVVGTFTPGYNPAEENKQIYEFDYYAITIVDSDGRPELNEGEYLLAKLSWDELGVLTVSDERITQMFNDEYKVNLDQSQGIIPLTSLLMTSVINGRSVENSMSTDIELFLEHGYKVTSQTLEVTETANIFNVVAGECNYLNDGQLPNNWVRGWVLVNRTNMKTANILQNIGNYLYLETVDGELILEENNDFVIIPNFREIEYEVTVKSNVSKPEVPFTFRNTITNHITRARIYALFPKFGGNDSVNVKIRYRMIDYDGNIYEYHNIATASYVNTNGDIGLVTDGSLEINVAKIEPEIHQRNYS